MMNREKQKKEQKTFEYIENPEQIEGFDKIPVPEDLDQRVRAGIEEGKKRRKKIAFRKTAKVGMGMAGIRYFSAKSEANFRNSSTTSSPRSRNVGACLVE